MEMADSHVPPVEAEDDVPDLAEVIEEPTTEKLNAILSDANVQYGLKNYAAAADLFGAAAAMQDALNGEMNPANADLLYLYGRCLYHVAVKNSDVLGGKVAGEKKREPKQSKSSANGEGSSATVGTSKDAKLAEDVVEGAVEAKDGASKETETKADNKPYFQFTEEPDYDSDEDEDAEEGGEEGELEEDDFANAYEILDVARVLFDKQLQAIDANDQLTNGKASEPGTAMDEQTRKVKETLADTYDLQAEISLENERFHDAIPDFRASLDLKHSLYPKEHNLIAEAHYKLSLALEFASVSAIRDAQAQEAVEAAAQFQSRAQNDAPQVDENLRAEAAAEMEAAISSCRLRIEKETADLEILSGEAKAVKERQIQDVREIAEEMSQRLIDLRNPAVVVSEGVGGAGDPGSGLLGQLLGESAGEQKQRIEEATRTANDLTGMVRKKKQPKAETSSEPIAEGQVNGKGKRKLEDGEAGDEKRAKTEEIA